MHRTQLYSATLALMLLASAGSAQAGDSNLDEPYLAIGLMLGLAGEVEIDEVMFGNRVITIDSDADAEADADVSIGGGAQYIHPLHEHFALGGKFALLSWRGESEIRSGRNLVFDLAIVPQARLQLTAAAELYLSVPLGISLNLLSERDGSAVRRTSETDPGFGWNLAVLLGTRLAVARSVGVFAELGYALHSVSHDIDFGGGVMATADVSWWQIALNAGLYF